MHRNNRNLAKTLLNFYPWRAINRGVGQKKKKKQTRKPHMVSEKQEVKSDGQEKIETRTKEKKS